jgi:hypothetical protein
MLRVEKGLNANAKMYHFNLHQLTTAAWLRNRFETQYDYLL